MKAIVPLLALAACGAQPAPEFFGAQRADVTRDDRQYTVFKTENRVEVIRLGYPRHGQHQAIRAQMIALFPEVAGCKLVESSLQGDSGEMRGSICCKAFGRDRIYHAFSFSSALFSYLQCSTEYRFFDDKGRVMQQVRGPHDKLGGTIRVKCAPAA